MVIVGAGDTRPFRCWSKKSRQTPLAGLGRVGWERLSLLLGPLLGQPALIEPATDDEFPLAQDLRLPAPGLAVEAQLGAPGRVIMSEAPDRLAGFRLPAGWARMVGAIEGVVAHQDTIP